MKRTAFRPRQQTLSQRAKLKKMRVANPLKASTRSAVTKGPSRDKPHLAKVRAYGCVVCNAIPCEAHHVRSIAPRSMGKRVSDYLTISLCQKHHAKLHAMNEGEFWIVCNMDPAIWIKGFSKEGAAEIAMIEVQREQR